MVHIVPHKFYLAYKPLDRGIIFGLCAGGLLNHAGVERGVEGVEFKTAVGVEEVEAMGKVFGTSFQKNFKSA